MDKLIYVAMNGAKQAMLAQAVNAHNLANVSTTGFRAELHGISSLPIGGPGPATRVNPLTRSAGWSSAGGAVTNTGRNLDVAISGEGWLVIQAPDGTEAYTRAGDLRVTSLGLLINGAGYPVMGESGPVAIPPHAQLSIGGDGTVSIVPLGQGPETMATVDRLKLVNPPVTDLVKRDDGLLHLRDGTEALPDAGVTLITRSLEGSNVTVVDAMVNMIELARQFEVQIRLLDAANDNAQAAQRLVRIT